MGVYLGSTQVDMQGGFVTGGASGASLQSKTVNPSESAQTIKADYGYDGKCSIENLCGKRRDEKECCDLYARNE